MITLRVEITEVDAPECDNGCWNVGWGVRLMEGKNVLYEQEAWAGCTENSHIDWNTLLEEIISIQSQHTMSLLDLGENPYEHYPQWFLEALM